VNKIKSVIIELKNKERNGGVRNLLSLSDGSAPSREHFIEDGMNSISSTPKHSTSSSSSSMGLKPLSNSSSQENLSFDSLEDFTLSSSQKLGATYFFDLHLPGTLSIDLAHKLVLKGGVGSFLVINSPRQLGEYLLIRREGNEIIETPLEKHEEGFYGAEDGGTEKANLRANFYSSISDFVNGEFLKERCTNPIFYSYMADNIQALKTSCKGMNSKVQAAENFL